MSRLSIAFSCLLLAACVQQPAKPDGNFRKLGAPMWSIAQLEASRLPGRWQQVAGFGAGDGRCQPGGAEIASGPGGLHLAARLCLGAQEARISGAMVPNGAGRFMVNGLNFWVIWVDTDYRTLAIATPDGAFGFVLNRGGALPADRLRAAREIFDFNGYDTARMQAY